MYDYPLMEGRREGDVGRGGLWWGWLVGKLKKAKREAFVTVGGASQLEP